MKITPTSPNPTARQVTARAGTAGACRSATLTIRIVVPFAGIAPESIMRLMAPAGAAFGRREATAGRKDVPR